jgi:hypothetical protein
LPFAATIGWMDEWPTTAPELAVNDVAAVLGNLHHVNGEILTSATLHFTDGRSAGGSYRFVEQGGNWTLTGEPRATWGN